MTESEQHQFGGRDEFTVDPLKFRPSPKEFQCGEKLEQDGDSIERPVVSFFCTLPENRGKRTDERIDGKIRNKHRLTFGCRDRSSGVLGSREIAITNDEFEAAQNTHVDPNFFDAGYTLAGRTGFQVWSGTRLMIEILLFPSENDDDRLITIQKEINSECGKNILELGAGVGVVGTILAAATSSKVLLTDLPTLVENSIIPNLKRNQDEERAKGVIVESSTRKANWLYEASRNVELEEEEEHLVFPIGEIGGWASVATIDWTEPLNEDLSSITSLDWIIASDCVWLKSMLDSLLDTVDSLFQMNPNARLLLSFQRRDSGDCTRFSSINSIVDSVRRRRWSINCLAWQYVLQEGEKEPKEVFVFEVAPLSVGGCYSIEDEKL